MKKSFRVIFAATITAVILITSLPLAVTVAAAPKAGDVLGDVLYSNITAYINNSAIPTSVIQGKTLVTVEDLANYGFDVKWDETARTLKVELNNGKKYNPIIVTKDTANKSGTFKEKYFYTEIKTYLSGELVESYAIKGLTLIDFELLATYGKLSWDGIKKEIRLQISGADTVNSPAQQTTSVPSKQSVTPPVIQPTTEKAAQSTTGAGYHKITAKEAKDMMDSAGGNYIILDVRTDSEYKSKHIAGAVLIPDYEIKNRAESELPDKNALIFVYCASGNRSKSASNALVGMGYTNIYDIGSIKDWTYGTVTG